MRRSADAHTATQPSSKKRAGERATLAPPVSGTRHPQDPVWKDGNFTVITSDGVEFRVHDYILFWASPVFAEAHSLSSGEKRIEFTDTKLETSLVFRLFLSVATTLKHSSGGGDFMNRAVRIKADGSLLLFLRKWECDGLYSLVMDSIASSVAFSTLPLHHFELASRINDVDLCVTALCSPYASVARDTRWNAESGRSPFDPDGWSVHFWREHEIPPDYLCTLMKVFKSALQHPDGSRDALLHLAGKFKAALKSTQNTP